MAPVAKLGALPWASGAAMLFSTTGVALAIAAVVLICDQIRFLHTNNFWLVNVQAWPWRPTDYAQMLYRPENLETKTTEMLLAAGVVGLGATLVVLLLQALKLWSCSPRSNADEQEVASKVEKRRKLNLGAIVVSAPALLANLVLVVLGAPRRPHYVPLESDYISPAPTDENAAFNGTTISHYTALGSTDLTSWNCQLHVHLLELNSRVRKQCNEGIAAFDVEIALVVVQAVGLGIMCLQYWRSRKAAMAAAWAEAKG